MADIMTMTVMVCGMLMIYTYIIKDNVFYRFIEHTIAAIAIGYTAAYAITNINKIALTPLMKGDILFIIPVIAGLLLFSRYTKDYSFLNRWSISLVVGIGGGIALRTLVEAQIIKQIVGVIELPLINVGASQLLGNIVVIIGVPCALFYFYFTTELENPTLVVFNRIGRYILMITFGAVFAAYILTRFSMLTDNFRFIIVDWLKTSLSLS